MNTVIPTYRLSCNEAKSKFINEMLSSANNTCPEISFGEIRESVTKAVDCCESLIFNSISLTESLQEKSYTIKDDTGNVILVGRKSECELFYDLQFPVKDKILFRIDLADDSKDPGQRYKILSPSSSTLGYISQHPSINLIQFDIRDATKRVCLTVESEHFYSSEFLVKANDGAKTVACIKKNAGNIEMKLLTASTELDVVSTLALIALLVIMRITNETFV